MRFMGWSYEELLQCPAAYIDVLDDVVRKELERARQR